MAQQGAGGGGSGLFPTFFDPARQQRCYYDHRTNEYVYEDNYRVPAQPSPSDPRTTKFSVSRGGQAAMASQFRPQDATSPTRAREYAHNAGGEQLPYGGRRQSHSSSLEQDMAKMNLATPAAPSTSQYERNGIRFTDVQNPISQVRTVVGTYPPNRITDPFFSQRGIHAQQMLMAIDGPEAEDLWPSFRLQKRGFFKVGRVFLVLWAEPAGESRASVISKPEISDRSIYAGPYNTKVHSKVRRFVVIREGENYCSALPVTTYGGQGVAKASVKKSEHAIIHTTREAPPALPSEQPTRLEQGGMRPIPIRVEPDEKTETLDPMSRIDFGKIHTIQHNLRVRKLGNVHPHSINALKTQFANVWSQTTVPDPPTVVAGSSGSRGQANLPAAQSSGKQPVRGSRRRAKHPAAEERDGESSGEESENNSDSSDDDDSGPENQRTQGRPALPPRTTAGASSQRNTQTQAGTSSGAAQVSWDIRVAQARTSYSNRLQRGYTPVQAVAEMVAGLQQQGRSKQEAEREIRALLSSDQS